MMISCRKFTLVASVAMLSGSALVPVIGQPTGHPAWAQTHGFRTCEAGMQRPVCDLVAMAYAQDDDWTASGGALRGLHQ
jgi:hypothetical protein